MLYSFCIWAVSEEFLCEVPLCKAHHGPSMTSLHENCIMLNTVTAAQHRRDQADDIDDAGVYGTLYLLRSRAVGPPMGYTQRGRRDAEVTGPSPARTRAYWHVAA